MLKNYCLAKINVAYIGRVYGKYLLVSIFVLTDRSVDVSVKDKIVEAAFEAYC